MKKVKVLISMAILFAMTIGSLISCKHGTEIEPFTATVSGIVISTKFDSDGDGGKKPFIKPVAGAIVNLGQYSTKTNENGVWILEKVQAGDYRVSVSKEGFISYLHDDKITVTAADYNKYDPENIQKLGSFYSKLISEVMEKLGEIDSTPDDTPPADDTSSSSSDSSDTDTSRYAARDAGDAAVVAASTAVNEISSTLATIVTEFFAMQKEIMMIENSFYSIAAEPAFLLPLSGTITGSVGLKLDSSEPDLSAEKIIPANGISVLLQYNDGTFYKETATTDENGVFTFTNVPTEVSLDITIPTFAYTIKGADENTPDKTYVFEATLYPMEGDTKIIVSDGKTLDLDKEITANREGLHKAFELTPFDVVTIASHNIGVNNPIDVNAAIEITFSEAIHPGTIKVKVGDIEGVVEMDDTNTTATIYPPVGSAWPEGEFVLELKDVKSAADNTKGLWSEYAAGKSNELSVYVKAFKIVSIELVENPTRMILDNKYKSLKITFNGKIENAKNITVNGKIAKTSISENILYISLDNATAEDISKVAGTVYGNGQTDAKGNKGIKLADALGQFAEFDKYQDYAIVGSSMVEDYTQTEVDGRVYAVPEDSKTVSFTFNTLEATDHVIYITSGKYIATVNASAKTVTFSKKDESAFVAGDEIDFAIFDKDGIKRFSTASDKFGINPLFPYECELRAQSQSNITLFSGRSARDVIDEDYDTGDGDIDDSGNETPEEGENPDESENPSIDDTPDTPPSDGDETPDEQEPTPAEPEKIEIPDDGYKGKILIYIKKSN